jgi:DNA-binding NtrC family response regulator
LERDYRQLQDEERPGMFEGILGSNEKMEEVFKTVGKVAKATAPVLILGESGTGKEMIANAIHRRSQRTRRQPPDLLRADEQARNLQGLKASWV